MRLSQDALHFWVRQVTGMCGDRVAAGVGSRAESRAGSRRTSASGGADAPAATDAATGVGSFELVDEAGPAAARHRAAPPTPLTADEWTSFLDANGRLRDAAALRRRVYSGGVAPELRKEVWKFLLEVYDPGSSAVARVTRSRELRERYERLSQQWKHIDGEQAAHWAKWRERRSQVRAQPACALQCHRVPGLTGRGAIAPGAPVVLCVSGGPRHALAAPPPESGASACATSARLAAEPGSASSVGTGDGATRGVALTRRAVMVQVEKDVVRTDRDAPLFAATDAPALGVMHRVLLSYIMFNQDLGYSQVRLPFAEATTSARDTPAGARLWLFLAVSR